MAGRIRIINGKGDWGATPPTGADDHDLQSFSNDFVASGGVLRPEAGELLVEEQDTPNMGVKVAPGIVYVDNSSWTSTSFEPQYYVVTRDAEELLDISSNPSGQTRYDMICQSIDKVTTPDDTASNVCDLVVVEGTPGETELTIPNDYELLAVVEVVDGATSITNAEILDYRRRVFVHPSATNAGIYGNLDDTTITFDVSLYDKHEVILEGNRTLAVTGALLGKPFIIKLIQDEGGNRTVTWFSTINWAGGAAPTLTTTAGKADVFGFMLNSSGDYDGFVIGLNL